MTSKQLVSQDRAFLAYNAKLAGFSHAEIADRLDYPSAAAVYADIKRHLEAAVQRQPADTREAMLQMERDRLDFLQSRVWPQCEYGDLKAIEAALKIINTRIKLESFDAIDSSAHVNTVLVVGGEERDYISKLKEVSEQNGRAS